MMFGEKGTKKVVGILVIVMLLAIYTTVVICMERGDNMFSRASDSTPEPTESASSSKVDELELYGIDLTEETEFQVKGDVDKTKYEYGLPEDISKGSIMHAWYWSFNTVKDNLADIAESGYCAIQLSPVNKCGVNKDGNVQFYTETAESKKSGKVGKDLAFDKYTSDWTIEGGLLGTQDELENLCKEAKEYGISIIVEVDANSTTKNVSKKFLEKAGGKDKLYHKKGFTELTNLNSRIELTTYAINKKPDVNTENVKVQDYFISFLEDCIKAGVSGFRFDNADAIALPDDKAEADSKNTFWTNVLKAVKKHKGIFVYGDVIGDTASRLDAYSKTIGKVTTRVYADNLRSFITNKKIPYNTVNYFSNSLVDTKKQITMIEDEDCYIKTTADTYSNYQIKLAWAAIAAKGSGTPLFFVRPEGGGIQNGWCGTTNLVGTKGSDMYQDVDIVAVNKFRNAMVDQGEKIHNIEDKSNLLVIERGKAGCVIINTGKSAKIDTTTNLEKDGTYVNKGSEYAEFIVNDGKITGTVPGESVMILYNDSEEKSNMPLLAVTGSKPDFYLDQITITLIANNVKDATYTFGGKEYKFNSGKQLTFGSSMLYNENVTVTLRAISNDGMIASKEYKFTKRKVDSESTIIRFEKPADWSKDIYVYLYVAESFNVKRNGAWPGKIMDDIGNGIYQYEVTSDWDGTLLVFNDTVNQYPPKMTNGVELVAGKTYRLE